MALSMITMKFCILFKIGKAKILFGLHDGTDKIWLASNEHDVQTTEWGTSVGVITGDDLGEKF